MNDNVWLSPRRFGRLLVLDGIRFAKLAGLLAAIAAGLLALGALLAGRPGPRIEYAAFLFGPFLYLGGWALAAGALGDMHNPLCAPRFLTVPASTVEKTLSRLLLVTAAFALGTMALFWAQSAIASLLSRLLRGYSLPVFDPFSSAVARTVRGMVVSAALFFFGGAVFRTHPFVKTALTLILTGVVVTAVTCVSGVLAAESLHRTETLTPERIQALFDSLGLGMRIFLFWILAPLCWIGAWIRVRTAQR
jgi:hypothetical protein